MKKIDLPIIQILFLITAMFLGILSASCSKDDDTYDEPRETDCYTCVYTDYQMKETKEDAIICRDFPGIIKWMKKKLGNEYFMVTCENRRTGEKFKEYR